MRKNSRPLTDWRRSVRVNVSLSQLKARFRINLSTTEDYEARSESYSRGRLSRRQFFPQDAVQDFPYRTHREIVSQLDNLRHLVRRHLGLAVSYQISGRCGRVRFENDARLDDLAVIGVGNADCRHQPYGRMHV